MITGIESGCWSRLLRVDLRLGEGLRSKFELLSRIRCELKCQRSIRPAKNTGIGLYFFRIARRTSPPYSVIRRMVGRESRGWGSRRMMIGSWGLKAP